MEKTRAVSEVGVTKEVQDTVAIRITVVNVEVVLEAIPMIATVVVAVSHRRILVLFLLHSCAHHYK